MQFLGRISQHFLIRKTVVNPLSVHIHDGDHVGGVLTDQVKQLFPIDQLAADSVNQKILIDGVEIEEENQTHQPSHGLGQHVLRIEILMNVSVRKKKRGQANREQESDDGGGCPQPPFPPLDPAEVRADVVGLRACAMAYSFWLMRFQESPSGVHSSLRSSVLVAESEVGCGPQNLPDSTCTKPSMWLLGFEIQTPPKALKRKGLSSSKEGK